MTKFDFGNYALHSNLRVDVRVVNGVQYICFIYHKREKPVLWVERVDKKEFTWTFEIALHGFEGDRVVQSGGMSDGKGRAVVMIDDFAVMNDANVYYARMTLSYSTASSVTEDSLSSDNEVPMPLVLVSGMSSQVLRNVLPNGWCYHLFGTPNIVYGSNVYPAARLKLPWVDDFNGNYSLIKTSDDGQTWSDVVGGIVEVNNAGKFVRFDDVVQRIEWRGIDPTNKQALRLTIDTPFYWWELLSTPDFYRERRMQLQCYCEVVSVDVERKNTELIPLWREVEGRQDVTVKYNCKLSRLDAYSYAYYAALLMTAEDIRIWADYDMLEVFLPDTTEGVSVALDAKKITFGGSPFAGVKDLTFTLIASEYVANI